MINYTNTPNMKNAPNTTETVARNVVVAPTNPIPNPTMPLKNSVANVTTDNISKLGKKNNADGIACNRNNINVTKNQSGKPINIGINVRKFHIHQRGQVKRVIGQIIALRISPMGIQITKLKGQKFHMISTS